MSKKRFEIEAEIPDGFEATGEWRRPRDGEYWVGSSGQRFKGLSGGRRIILRKIPPATLVVELPREFVDIFKQFSGYPNECGPLSGDQSLRLGAVIRATLELGS